MRWNRYSLRTLILIVLMCGATIGLWKKWSAWSIVKIVHPRDQTHEILRAPNGSSEVIKKDDNYYLKFLKGSAKEPIRFGQSSGYFRYSRNSERMALVREVVGSSDIIELYDAVDGKLLCEFKFDSNSQTLPVFNFSSDGKYLVAPAVNPNPFDDEQKGVDLPPRGSVKIINTTTGKIFRMLPGNGKFVSDVKFSTDASRVVVGNWDYSFKIFDVQTGKCVHRFSEEAQQLVLYGGFSVSFSMDDTKVMAVIPNMAESTVSLWDVTTEKELWRNSTLDSPRIQFFPDNLRFLLIAQTLGLDRNEVAQIVSLHDGEVLTSFEVYDMESPLDLSNDGPITGLRENGARLIWRRMHPEWWWGIGMLWEFWAVVIFIFLLIWSVWSDVRRLGTKLDKAVSLND